MKLTEFIQDQVKYISVPQVALTGKLVKIVDNLESNIQSASLFPRHYLNYYGSDMNESNTQMALYECDNIVLDVFLSL